MSDRLVTLASYTTSFEAQMAKNLLETNGIIACVAEENSAAMLGTVGSLLAGAKVLVNESDALRAELILESVHDEPDKEEEEEPPDRSEEISTTRTCPRCGRPFSDEFDQCPRCAPSEGFFEDVPDRPKPNLARVGPSDDVVEAPYTRGDEYASRALLVAILVTFFGSLVSLPVVLFAETAFAALGMQSVTLAGLVAAGVGVCLLAAHLYVFYQVGRFLFYQGECRKSSEYKAIAAAFISGGYLCLGLLLALNGLR